MIQVYVTSWYEHGNVAQKGYYPPRKPATAKNVLFPGHNYLLTTGADDPPF